ncbi:MAG: hypothetical protein IKS65_03095 [Bacteroidales bacterium]|nr:hypothetical protein [Bacteroidales bacterium]
MEKLEFPKCAVFYTRTSDGLLKASDIRNAFNAISAKRYGDLYGGKFVVQQQYHGFEEIRYSFCAFKKRTKPSCFAEMPDSVWQEVKFAYVVIVEYDGYVAISRKLVPQLKEINGCLKEIDYQKMSSAFITDTTQYQKIGLKNLDMSDTAIRGKSIEAINLVDNFSTTGANNFVLNQCRLLNSDGIVSLAMNSSKVNRLSDKDDFGSFLTWVKGVVGCFKSCVAKQSFLTAFAESIDYDSERNKLIPASILFYPNELLTAFDNGLYDKVIVKVGDIEKNCPFSLTDILKKVDLCRPIEKQGGDYVIVTKERKPIYLQMAKGKIKVKSEKYNAIHLVKSDGESESLIDYVNSNTPYVVYFDQYEYRYTNRKLFKDNSLLGNLEQFTSVFDIKSRLATDSTTSEKGNFSNAHTVFDPSSEFAFFEDEYMGEYDEFICDDLGKEWADHIGIADGRVSFFLSKYHDSQFSATSFQDVVGQALKNLGNMKPDAVVLESRHDDWNKNYNAEHANTKIPRLRKGTSVRVAIDRWKKAILNPNLRRDMYLIINFIAKDHLVNNLSRMQAGEIFGERKQTVQILWLVSSLISQCHEQGVGIHIVCKEKD